MGEQMNVGGDYRPVHLGRASNQAVEQVDLIPWQGGEIVITLECGEFTSLCPVTGQPDFGRLTIRYAPRRHLVETKSLKLYLASFRNQPGFNEDITVRIAEALYAQVAPAWLEVEGHFHSRGGIALNTLVRRSPAVVDGGGHGA